MSGLVIPLMLALAALAVAVTAQKEGRFKTCKRNQPAPKLNECVKDAMQKAIPELVKGLPEYGFKSIDPLRVDSLEVPKSGKSAVNLAISLKNLDIIGLKNAKIINAVMDVSKYFLKSKFEVHGPITLQGDYKIQGKVLVLPIKGEGRCNITLVNPKAEIKEVKAKPVMKKGKEYAHVTSLKIEVTHVDKVHYDLQNLFDGNKELGDNMNLVLNDNWKAVYDDVIHPVEMQLSKEIEKIFERLLSQCTYNSIFP